MSATEHAETLDRGCLLAVAVAACRVARSVRRHAAAPGITGPTFNLTAQTGLHHPAGRAGDLLLGLRLQRRAERLSPRRRSPARLSAPRCRFPGPTLIVTEGQTVTVTLTNNLPAAAGNTSILFPGFQVTPPPAVQPAC